MPLQEDRDLVIAYLHHGGAHREGISNDHMWAAYCEGDGYGHLPPEALSEINGGWDWSHVRDSTPAGWARMASWLRDNGYGIDGPAPRPAA